ncbi:MAG TPA: carbohydrate ABC transporter permease [Bacillota bacterium]|nr:carbohydrate ABC transporter permease [Bacillota bacterium]HPZ54748.1 carbohydrate ABC transporter permease [Bacillota bacterium]HQD18333.1 carbohydrate ABC transporter permease [Bacillota bacterium]
MRASVELQPLAKIRGMGMRIARHRLHPARLGSLAWATFRAVLVIGISFVIVFPLLVRSSLAFRAVEDMMDMTVNWVPRNLTLVNFQIAMKHMDYLKSAAITTLICLLLAAIEVAMCMVIGYGFGRFSYPGSQLLFGLVILSLMIPPSVVMVPLFLNFRYFTIFGLLKEPGLNLIGTSWPLILMSLTGTAKKNGLFIYIVRQYFKGVANELEEAAYVDGASPLRAFVSVMVPNAGPILMVVFLFSFVWHWNDLFYSDLFLKGMKVLPLALQSLTERFAYSWADPNIDGSHITLVSSAAMLLYIVPLLILYAVLQRHFVESIEKTGIVG